MAFVIVGKTQDGQHIVRTQHGISWKTTAELEAEIKGHEDSALAHTANAMQIREQLAAALED